MPAPRDHHPLMTAVVLRDDGGRGGVTAVTAAAELRFASDGTIDATQAIVVRRALATVRVGGATAPWRAEGAPLSAHPSGSVRLVRGDGAERVEAVVRPDGIVALTTRGAADLDVRPAFAPLHVAERGARALVLDDAGGVGVFPVGPAHDRTDASAGADGGARARPRATLRRRDDGSFALRLPPGEEVWISFLPARPADPSALALRVAHEGRPAPFPEAAHPSRDVIDDAARTCRVLAVHAYVWQPAPLAARLTAGRYALRRCQWRTPRHEPADPERFAGMKEDARRAGMRLVLYLSPRHSTAPELFPEMERVLETHAPDGLYLDEIGGGPRRFDEVIRRARALLGPSRLLYVNAADEPFGSPLLPLHAADAHADLVLRGSEGTGGLSLADHLRRNVSGRATSGAVGMWCHYAGDLRERPPTDAQIDAAADAGVRLWRRSLWGAEALRRFDARYGPAHERMLREDAAGAAPPAAGPRLRR